MRKRRWNLFILLFVMGLIAASVAVIATTSTKLGLDLKGGVELIYQGQPTGQVEEVTGEDIDRSIEIIRERIDKLGVAEPEVSRLGTDNISVSLPDVTNAQRAIRQVGTTAQLYFFDWEPNLIGPERVLGGHPGQEPTSAAALEPRTEQWRDAGRNPRHLSQPPADPRRGACPPPTTRSCSPPSSRRWRTARPARPGRPATTSSPETSRTS